MEREYPMSFELDDKTNVIVNKTSEHKYRFLLKPDGGPEQQFVYNEEEEFTTEREKAMPFAHLNALRRFWLETRNEE